MQKLNETINMLRTLENKSAKEHYKGDATEYAFRRHTLMLLRDFKPVKVDRLLKRIEKLERDLDFYIKEYPEQLENLEENKDDT